MNISGFSVNSSYHSMAGASPRTSASTMMSNLFDQIDTNGSGTITKSQFEQAFEAKSPSSVNGKTTADELWSKLDPNGTGTVSKQDFVSTMTSALRELRGRPMRHNHHHSEETAGAASPSTTMSNLFDQIDTNGTGTITKSQFEQAIESNSSSTANGKATADKLWSELDPNGTGSVSKQNFVNTITSELGQPPPILDGSQPTTGAANGFSFLMNLLNNGSTDGTSGSLLSTSA